MTPDAAQPRVPATGVVALDLGAVGMDDVQHQSALDDYTDMALMPAASKHLRLDLPACLLELDWLARHF